MSIYNETGALNVAVNDTTGVGRYSASGALRVTVVPGTSFTGVYASDGSTNIVDVSSENLSTYVGLYHPSGAIRGRLAQSSYTGIYAADGAIYLNGLTSITTNNLEWDGNPLIWGTGNNLVWGA